MHLMKDVVSQFPDLTFTLLSELTLCHSLSCLVKIKSLEHLALAGNPLCELNEDRSNLTKMFSSIKELIL